MAIRKNNDRTMGGDRKSAGGFLDRHHDNNQRPQPNRGRRPVRGRGRNLRTRQGQFINRRTGQSVSPNMPYHTHEGQAMAGAMHVDTPHDKYDRSMNNSGNQNNMRRTRRRRLGRDNY